MDTFLVVMTVILLGGGWLLYREVRSFLGDGSDADSGAQEHGNHRA